MPPKDDRLRIAPLGEWHRDLLAIDALLHDRTDSVHAASLLTAKLEDREAKIRQTVQYLADKRGVSIEELWLQILQGKFQKLSLEELSELGDRPSGSAT